MKIYVYASPRYLTVVHDDGNVYQIEPHKLGLGNHTKKEAEALAVLTSLDNYADITEVCSDELISETVLTTSISQIKDHRDRKRLEKLIPKLQEIKFSKISLSENQAAIIAAQTTEFASGNGKVKKVITVRLSELSDDPRKYQLPQSVVLTRQFGFWREEYTLYASYLTNVLYLIQDLASIFEAHGVKCKISSFTEPERGRNVYNLWVRTKSPVRVEYIP